MPLSKLKRDLFIVVTFALLVGLYLHWPAVVNHNTFNQNWRQAPHWTPQAQQQFQKDDIIIAYAKFNAPPFANFLYQNLARTGYDLIWGKIAALLFFNLTVVLLFITAFKLSGRVGAWVAVVLFSLFPCMFYAFAGGYMHSLFFSIVILAVLIIHQQKWKWALLLFTMASLIYPMAAIFAGLMFIVDTLANDLKNLKSPLLWRSKLIPLILAAVITMGLIGTKYLEQEHGFGEIVNRAQIAQHIEYTAEGRYHLIPVPSYLKELRKHWGNSFHIFLFLLAYFFLLGRAFRLPRGLYAVLFASFLAYYLADIFLMKLYIPNRYVRFPLPVFMALTAGFWVNQIYTQKKIRPRLFVSIGLAIILIGSGSYHFHKKFRQGIQLRTYNKAALHTFVKALPNTPLIAAHPRLSSEIPLLTGKSVLVASKLTHPWWTDYWKIMKQRTFDLFRAMYTQDKDLLMAFIEKYKIDYFIVEPARYKNKYIKAKHQLYMEPFDSFLKHDIKMSKQALLNQIPKNRFDFYNGKTNVISKQNLLKWLEEN